MATEEEKQKVESLKLIVEEQRRDLDYLLHIYDRMRATEALLLTAGLGVLIYLYSKTSEVHPNSLKERMFFPPEDYGKVIYVIAAAFFFYGLIKLMLNVCGNNWWDTAYESPKDNYKYTSVDTLTYFRKRYDKIINLNGERYGKRKEELMLLFFCILISAIILIVIKSLARG